MCAPIDPVPERTAAVVYDTLANTVRASKFEQAPRELGPVRHASAPRKCGCACAEDIVALFRQVYSIYDTAAAKAANALAVASGVRDDMCGPCDASLHRPTLAALSSLPLASFAPSVGPPVLSSSLLSCRSSYSGPPRSPACPSFFASPPLPLRARRAERLGLPRGPDPDADDGDVRPLPPPHSPAAPLRERRCAAVLKAERVSAKLSATADCRAFVAAPATACSPSQTSPPRWTATEATAGGGAATAATAAATAATAAATGDTRATGGGTRTGTGGSTCRRCLRQSCRGGRSCALAHARCCQERDSQCGSASMRRPPWRLF